MDTKYYDNCRYQKDEKSRGLSADNPEPAHSSNWLLWVVVLIISVIGYFGYRYVVMSVSEDEVMPARICQEVVETPADTDKDEISEVKIVSEERITSDNCIIAKIVLSDGSVVNDTIYFERQLSSTNWE
jgi:hypothetical protein